MMKRILCILSILCVIDLAAMAQGTPPLTVQEVDGSPRKTGITKIVVTNGTLSITGNTATITISGGGGGSPGGSTTQVQYNDTGAFAGAAGFTFNGTSTVTLGVAGTSVGAIAFKNATSGTVTLQPVTGALGTVTLSLPAATDTLVGLAATQTLTNKTLTAPTIGDFTNATHSHANSAGGGTLAASVIASGQIAAARGGTGLDTSASTGYPSLSAGTWSVVNATTLTAALNAVVGDSGAGGTKGLVPAPAAGDAAASKYLKADGTWATVSGGGGLTVGTTAIASGTAGRLIYEAAGNVLGEISGVTSNGSSLTALPVAGVITQTSASATAFESGPNGGTNPVFRLVNSTASSATGLSITGNAAGSGVTLTALSSGTNENVILNPKGSGVLQVGGSGNKIQGDTTSQTLELSSANGSILSYGNTKFFAGGAANVQVGASAIQQWGTNSANLGPSTVLSWAATGSAANAADTYLRRNGAANVGLGATTAAAAPVAQTISAESVVAGTTNTAGATWKLIGSLGTSQGAPGVIDFQTGGMIAASGSTQQTAVSRLALGATKVLTNNTVTTLVNVTNASNTAAGGVIDYTVEVFDGTDVQTEVGSVSYMVTNKGGAWSGNTATKFGNAQNMTAGTLTVTWAISGANPALLSVNANSSLTPSTGYPRVSYNVRSLSQQAIAIQ